LLEAAISDGVEKEPYGLLSALRLLSIQLRHVAAKRQGGRNTAAMKAAGLESKKEDGPPPMSAGAEPSLPAGKSVARKLLSAIFRLLHCQPVLNEDGSESASPIAMEASAALVSGFDIFYPSAIQQVYGNILVNPYSY